MREISIELREKNVEEIRQYFRDFDKGNETVCRVKVLLVGDGMQGKTSLLNFLKTGESMKSEPERTDGIDIHLWKQEREGEEITLSAWDFAGQEV